MAKTWNSFTAAPHHRWRGPAAVETARLEQQLQQISYKHSKKTEKIHKHDTTPKLV
jgi:hypothetical protein